MNSAKKARLEAAGWKVGTSRLPRHRLTVVAQKNCERSSTDLRKQRAVVLSPDP